jgi:hypothetical protein
VPDLSNDAAALEWDILPPPNSTAAMRARGELPPRRWTAAEFRRNPQDYFDEIAGRDVRFTQEGTERRARQRGQVIEYSTPRTLQIDIDGREAYDRFEAMLELWESCPTLPRPGNITERESRTPGNMHITVEMDGDLPVQTRILFQALLGSDLKRELLSLASHMNGHENPIVFYRNPENTDASTQTGPRDGTDSSGLSGADLSDLAF